MADPERAVFFDGQYITADDLTVVVDHDQQHIARHSRLLHDWGIADGLTLDKQTSGGSTYAEVQKGMAVDPTGREVVVSSVTRLSESLFKQINGASTQPGAWYPVFLRGKDGPAAQAAATPTACGTNGRPTRVAETFEITFGHIGDASLEQPAPDVTAGPGPYGSTLWNVLLGFVQWDGQQFTDTSDTADGVSRRYAGVRAASVAAGGGGLLELRPDLTRQTGNIGLSLGGTPPVLKFGVYKTDGTIDPQVTIDAAGNVKANGTVSGALTAGQPVVQSGIATDGMILQLPAGITQAEVDSGKAVLHVHVTPHDPGPSAPAILSSLIGPVVDQCHVDSTRRVRCMLRWFDSSGGGQSVGLPAPVDYLLIATAG
jgi:hypothetical protein